MSEKYFPLDKAALEKIAKRYPTPFYIYDEKAIIENARRIKAAYSRFPGYKEHFAVKALPNPFILKILAAEGFGADCSSLPELILADMAGMKGEDLMFSANETPASEYRQARKFGAVINLDDFTHIEFLEKTAGLPELISLRYNPGPLKEGNAIIGKPEEAKYGFTREQLIAGYSLLKEKGVKRFALHTMVASNELSLPYHIETARMLFELAVEVKNKTGIRLEFVNLGGGVGIPYRPEQTAVDYEALASGIKSAYDEIIKSAGLDPLGIHTEWGRTITGPYGWLVARAVHKKEIYRKYIALDACMADLMRPALYGAYHHITVPGRENEPLSETYDVVGSLCENNDKFAIQRQLPKIETSAEIIVNNMANSTDNSTPDNMANSTVDGMADSEADNTVENMADSVANSTIYNTADGMDDSTVDNMANSTVDCMANSVADSKADSMANSVANGASANCGDFVVIHDAGAHGRAMGFNYNAKLRCGELLLRPDGSIVQIRRAETVDDYFATLDISGVKNFC